VKRTAILPGGPLCCVGLGNAPTGGPVEE